MNRNSLFIAVLVGLFAALPAMAQFVNPNADIPGNSTPTPSPVTQPQPPAPTPAPPVVVVTPPPTPPTPTYTSPLLVGAGSGTQGQTVQSVFSSLNNQIASYNAAPSPDLPIASTSRTSQVVLPNAPAAATAPAPTSGFVNPNADTPSNPTTPTVPTNSGVTQLSVDVTGWSYLVLQWGDVNYHFYVGGVSGVQTFSGNAPLSSYAFFSSSAAQAGVPVPETASTFLLVGSALALLGAIRRTSNRDA